MAAEVVDLNHRPLPSKRKIKRTRNDLVRWLSSLDDEAVDDLWRRLEEPTGHDGYGVGGDPDGSHGSPAEARPVESLGTRMANPRYRPPADPLLECGRRLVRHLTRAHDELAEANRVRQVILKAGEARQMRQSTVQVCDVDSTHICMGTKTDRLRNGFCWSCYEAWRRWLSDHAERDRANLADRQAFIVARRATLAEQQGVEGHRDTREWVAEQMEARDSV